MRTFPIKLLLCASCLAGLSLAAQAVPVTHNDTAITGYITGNTGKSLEYFGESFTAAGTTLTDFQLFVQNSTGGDTVSLVNFDPATGTLGQALKLVDTVQYGPVEKGTGFGTVDFNFNFISPLVVGQDYLLTVSANQDENYALTTDATDPAINGEGWASSDGGLSYHTIFGGGENLASSLTFDGVPGNVASVPDSGSSLMLLGMGCLGLCIVGKLGRSRVAQAS